MSTKIVSFRSPASKIATLEEIAEIQNRDRSFVINEAIDQYLDLYEYHRSIIAEAMREVEAGTAELIPHDEVMKGIDEHIRMREKERGQKRKEA
jgi:predicted transcriptional regulator